MKNLYHLLGIGPKASREEVAAALKLKPEMGGCAPILQDEEKRAAYNQAHATLSAIGILRHRLGLDSGDSWFLKDSPDFTPRLLQENKTRAAQKSVSQATTPGNNQAGPPQQQPPEPSTGSNQTLLIIAAVVIAMLAILAYAFL
jgi:hypothetical protein